MPPRQHSVRDIDFAGEYDASWYFSHSPTPLAPDRVYEVFYHRDHERGPLPLLRLPGVDYQGEHDSVWFFHNARRPSYGQVYDEAYYRRWEARRQSDRLPSSGGHENESRRSSDSGRDPLPPVGQRSRFKQQAPSARAQQLVRAEINHYFT
ncbi:unnamed protein product [Vitrella brassicaformis CCMP3155]|uniref:Uncharacterized protein n=1 Tax=Vitrella brassicaformis (strain CCMP3155) TaxID=1169540 RepID=A0A0G4F1B6_VITBC|nr:unnamed protein product [Vitrella brassicaformis CCMP3155]|eukprot:CEM05507.1 unnamed protein product [Vitrella brassicaformis CCMP3155]